MCVSINDNTTSGVKGFVIRWVNRNGKVILKLYIFIKV